MIRPLVIRTASMVLLAGGATFGQVVVDGDLSDIRAVSQGDLADPENDVCIVGKSGFDFSHLYVFYDVANDALYLGLDLMDSPPGIGMPGPGVPGDADGDGNADLRANSSCITFPFSDEFGVGPDEYYQFLLDTNGNNRSDEPGDVRVQYSNNSLGIFPGNSAVPIPGATGTIQLGTAGSIVASAGIPDTDENRNTTDIEVRVDNWSTLDPDPTSFIVTIHNGSLVDGLGEETSARLRIDVVTCGAGTVNSGPGPIADVLRVSGSTGGPNRTVQVARQTPVGLSLSASPAGPASARYVIWMWAGPRANDTNLIARGSLLGCTVNPTPLSPADLPQPISCLRAAGMPAGACHGVSERRAPPRAPWSATKASGFSNAITLTFQGVLEDSGAGNPRHFSVTNAVTLVVQ
ncbi:MAG: hypothetical protein HYR85_25235 [Planctomycetes bacterium]|nr:hypothetical protein [Planctomycetota bacterium]MBI3843322.1 hypothetical protein [Planctomycetota bacterium]